MEGHQESKHTDRHRADDCECAPAEPAHNAASVESSKVWCGDGDHLSDDPDYGIQSHRPETPQTVVEEERQSCANSSAEVDDGDVVPDLQGASASTETELCPE